MRTQIQKVANNYKALAAGLVLFVASFAIPQTLTAQAYRVQSYTMKVSGTSNLHDWDMKVLNASTNANFTLKANSPLMIADLNDLSFSVPVKGLKSEHDLMDSRAYSTLNADKNPTISFKMASAEVAAQGNNQYVIKAHGNLTFNGKTKPVVLTTKGVLNADKSITVTGQQKIKMSEWGVKPPSFMLGALKVGDLVTLDFNMKFVN
ncbi:MAG: YceI family protein [Flavisolibacter sp.]